MLSMRTTVWTTASLCWLLPLLLVVTHPTVTSGFIPQTRRTCAFLPKTAGGRSIHTQLFDVATQSGFELKRPTADEAAELGARDWPKQVKMGSWNERFDQGQVAARYVLEGGGMVMVTLFENDGFTPKTDLPEEYRLVPGSLVEVMGPCKLDWQTDENKEMILLTPGYEQGSLLAAVAALFIVLCGALIGGVGQ